MLIDAWYARLNPVLRSALAEKRARLARHTLGILTAALRLCRECDDGQDGGAAHRQG